MENGGGVSEGVVSQQPVAAKITEVQPEPPPSSSRCKDRVACCCAGFFACIHTCCNVCANLG
nr:nymph-specific protein N3 [Ischnura senegalensis]